MTNSAQVKGLLGEVHQILNKRMDKRNKNILKLLGEVRLILELQEKHEKLKGEKFNVFSILGMESKENQTHSAFIGELLNRKGSHLKEHIFLELFLDTVGNRKNKKGQEVDASSAWVEIEKHIGTVDPTQKTGGRIDIYIKDKEGNSVSIENKIYAGDQDAQVERYYNHNEEQNIVYYLTLNGDDPSKKSKGDLESQEHYFNISYQKHIVEWLELCLKESADQPILRETIKQYIVLIRRLTFTMNDEYEEQLIDLLSQNYNTANYIVENIPKVKQKLGEKLCEEIIEKLEQAKNEKYIIKKQSTSEQIFIQIKLKGYEQENSCFLVGPFNNINQWMFFGIYDIDKKNIYEPILVEHEKNENDWKIDPESEWPKYRFFRFDGKRSSVADMLLELHANEDNKNRFIEHIVSEVQKYISPKQHS